MTPQALKLLLSRPIAFHRVFATVAGGALPGLFLSQCFYWATVTDDPDGWFYKGREEWIAETGMTRRELDSARSALRELGILKETQRGGMDRRVWFALDMELLAELVQAAVAEASPLVRNVPMDRHETYQSNGTKRTVDHTETTTEITSETTTESNSVSSETSSPAPAAPAGKSKRSTETATGTRLPADWEPDAALLDWARQEFPDVDLRYQTDQFRDHWHAKTGADARKADWRAAFRYWIRNAPRYAPRQPSRPASTRRGPVTPEQATANIRRDVADMTEGDIF
jgi:hypothetical protein